MQSGQLVYVLPLVAFMLQWKNKMIATETILPKSPEDL